ncbi:hypothetical protein PCANC_06459 [Puccinia coronata f. sp. avenae]|uniref:Uncharacterized protein n=1 Tax=Puccinia coronata f. sp. avenae TaxID=200324 RepID=A0A2N5T1Q5_9BASI|nr:hypothetical protein PCASD_16571 [Puccinia coronata f. sp. avenae]PLW34645.1 hypothetical protein PCASD_11996 [Puccinia coronata f. sp. avenae]PLW54140.1 hypothetical protein PCANC_06459 [Puccinia coronata f. sp. avenae]
MLLTFFTLAVTFLSSFYGVSTQHVDPSTNPNSTIESFSFFRKWSWSNKDFDLTANHNSTQVMKLRTSVATHWLTRFGLTVTLVPSQEQFKVKINSAGIWCGFEQTYKIKKDGKTIYQYMIDPRGLNVDRWHIKKSGNLTQSYTWKRHATGLAGVVKRDDTHKKVAYFKAETFGSTGLAAALHSTLPGTTNYTIITNGEVPLVVLVSVYEGHFDLPRYLLEHAGTLALPKPFTPGQGIMTW